MHDDNKKGGPATQPVPAASQIQNQLRVAKTYHGQEDDPFAHVPDGDLESLAESSADAELEADLAKLVARLRRDRDSFALQIAGLKGS